MAVVLTVIGWRYPPERGSGFCRLWPIGLVFGDGYAGLSIRSHSDYPNCLTTGWLGDVQVREATPEEEAVWRLSSSEAE